jgi:hypothetical protein
MEAAVPCSWRLLAAWRGDGDLAGQLTAVLADLRLRYPAARNRSADQCETKCGACQRTVKHVIVHSLSLGAVHVDPLDGE